MARRYPANHEMVPHELFHQAIITLLLLLARLRLRTTYHPKRQSLPSGSAARFELCLRVIEKASKDRVAKIMLACKN